MDGCRQASEGHNVATAITTLDELGDQLVAKAIHCDDGAREQQEQAPLTVF